MLRRRAPQSEQEVCEDSALSQHQDSHCDNHEWWYQFQKQQMRECVSGASVRTDVIFVFIVLSEATLSIWRGKNWRIASAALVCTSVLFIILTVLNKLRADSHAGSLKELRCCIAHNGLKSAAFFGLFSWRVVYIADVVLKHKAFVSSYLLTMVASIHFNYLPLNWYMTFATVPAAISWVVFHWREDYVTATSVSWAVIWPCIGILYFRFVESREWTRYQSMRKEKELRTLSEAWEKTLRNMLSSVFDATCECDATGKVLHASPHFTQLVGIADDIVVGSDLLKLAVGACESDRTSAFLEHIASQGYMSGESCPAAKLATSLRHEVSGQEVALSLSCVPLPSEGGRASGKPRLLIGCQRTQSDPTCSPDLHVLQADVPKDATCLERMDKLLESVRELSTTGPRDIDFDRASSLSYTLTNITAGNVGLLDNNNRACTATQETQTEDVSLSATHRLAREIATQTEQPASKSRPPHPPGGKLTPPPLPRPERRTVALKSTVSFKSSRALHKKFKATPASTIKLLLAEMADRLNPSGSRCCSLHMFAATVVHVLNTLNTVPCCHKWCTPPKVWQCSNCLAPNAPRDVDSDEEGEEEQEEEDQLACECSVCGTARGGANIEETGLEGRVSSGSSCHADMSHLSDSHCDDASDGSNN